MRYRPSTFLKRDGNTSVREVLWISITPKVIQQMDDLNARLSGQIITTGSEYPTYCFVMPSDFGYSLNHRWDTLDTVAGAGRQIWSSFKNASKRAGFVTGNRWGQNGFGDKSDSPFVYADSDRRTYSLNFELMNEGNPHSDVYEPIHHFLQMSSAVISGAEKGKMAQILPDVGGEIGDSTRKAFSEVAGNEYTGFRFPDVFTLKTFYFNKDGVQTDSDILQMDYGVLTSVQPKLVGPYVHGYPSKAELTLTFTDMLPTYRTSFTTGVKVDVKENGR